MKITIALFPRPSFYISSYIFLNDVSKEYFLGERYTPSRFDSLSDWEHQFPKDILFFTLDLHCKVEELSREYLLEMIPELLL